MRWRQIGLRWYIPPNGICNWIPLVNLSCSRYQNSYKCWLLRSSSLTLSCSNLTFSLENYSNNGSSISTFLMKLFIAISTTTMLYCIANGWRAIHLRIRNRAFNTQKPILITFFEDEYKVLKCLGWIIYMPNSGKPYKFGSLASINTTIYYSISVP